MIREDVKSLYEAISKEHTDIDHYMMKMFMQQMPNEAKEALEEFENIKEYGYHIIDDNMYKKYIRKLPMVKWEQETIKNLSKINFDEKDYYCYDFAFLVNYLYCLFGDFINDSNSYFRMAQSILENKMISNSDDMAYHIAKKIISE